MSFREVPPHVESVLTAARRIYPQHSLFVTIAPEQAGPAWELHPYKRWLVLRTEDQRAILEAVACSFLARTAWLGKGALTAVPEHLQMRFQQAHDALVGAFDVGSGTEGALS